MRLDDISAEDLPGTDTTVVWALWSWETIGWPSVRSVGHVEKGVLLLQTEPRLMRLVGLHKLCALVTVVEFVWGSIGIPALCDHQDVGSATEWIGKDGDWAEVYIGVVAWGLACRASIEVPLWEVLELELAALWYLGEGLADDISECSIGFFLSRMGWSYCLPWTWSEFHQLSRSRCTFTPNQTCGLSIGSFVYSLSHSTSLLVKGHVLHQL